jgi:F-type H+-transporting ATPase subunit delta
MEQVYGDMELIAKISKSNPDFVSMLKSPVIHADMKIKALDAILKKQVSELTVLFYKLLVKKERESVLPEIAKAFIEQYKVFNNIHVVNLTTAVALSDELIESILEQIRATTDMQKIELQTKVDESLIGGFILQIGDKMVEGSVSYDLKQIARQFENNDFIYKIR